LAAYEAVEDLVPDDNLHNKLPTFSRRRCLRCT
jgi:hypothetical protein